MRAATVNRTQLRGAGESRARAGPDRPVAKEELAYYLSEFLYSLLRFEAADETYDVVEPYTALYEGRPETKRVRTFYADIAEVPRENRYDRIISIATLEHVLDLPRLVAQAATLLKPEGTFAAGIPSEGGFLWNLAWRSSVGLSFRIH